jgi:hypothetical protein
VALPEFCIDGAEPVCCDSLYTQATTILTLAWDAYQACASDTCCAPMERMVAHAEPHLATQDYLAVWVSDISMPPLTFGQTKRLNVTQPRVTFNVKLVESNYPTLDSSFTEVYEPLAAEVDFAARYSLAHAEAVYRHVVSALISENICGTLASINALRPLDPLGGLCAWTFSVTTETAWR